MNETILLIEDNESIIMGLEYLLTEEQYTFLAAKTKKEAQDLLASRQVDLVLLDVSLPDGNGFDLCRKIKEHDIAPVIFLTAKDEEKDVVLGFDLGADDYVIKPFRNRELVSLFSKGIQFSVQVDQTCFILGQTVGFNTLISGIRKTKNIINRYAKDILQFDKRFYTGIIFFHFICAYCFLRHFQLNTESDLCDFLFLP